MRTHPTPPPRNRVLMIVQNLPVPFDRRVWLEARALQAAGYRVTVICPKGRGAERSREVLEEIRILRYRAVEARARRAAFLIEFGWCWLRTFFLTLLAAFRGGFDILHACNPPDTFFVIGLLYRPFGKRFVFDQHDLCPELYISKFPKREGDAMHRTLLFLERCTYRTAHAVLATNESYRDVAIARGGVSPDRVFVVRSGPDAERIREEPPDPAERHGARHVLGYLGTMSTQDGVDGLLRVFSALVHRHGRRDLHLVLVGGGPLLEEMRSLARDLGLGPYVTFTGRVPDGERFRRILCSTDVCVSPDPPNPLNDMSTMNKTLEYMAFGRPVVAYALKETMVSAGDAAVYARPGSEEDLARRILELLDDPERRRTLAQRGRLRIRESLSWERSVPHLLAAYELVASPRGAPRRAAFRQDHDGLGDEGAQVGPRSG